MTTPLELGLDTFGDVTVDQHGHRLHDAEVIRNVVAEAVLADRVGIDFFGVGEHHRPDFAVSAPDVVLTAANDRAPHRITTWVRELAGAFHGFYHDCYVISDQTSAELTQARLWLVEAAEIGLAWSCHPDDELLDAPPPPERLLSQTRKKNTSSRSTSSR